MSPVAPDRRTARREELLAKLVAAMNELLLDGTSFTEVSVSRLVAEAEVPRSSFYFHFQDKGDLVSAAFAQVGDEVQAAAAAWWSLDRDLTRDDLRRVIEGILLAYRPHAALMAAVFDTAPYDESAQAEVDRLMARSIAGLREHIKRGQAEGWIDPELLPAETARWIVWMSERVQHQVLRDVPRAELDPWIEAFADLVWQTLYTVPGHTVQESSTIRG